MRRSTSNGPARREQRVLPAARRRRRLRAVLLAGDAARRRPGATGTTGSVAVVGLGPGDTDWMTPQSRRELAAATDLIGYGPYLDRVGDPGRPAPSPQRQHRRAGTRPAGLRAGRAGPRRRGGVLRRSGRVRDGHRGARGGQAVAGRAGAGHPGDDRRAGGRQPGRRAARPRLRRHLAVRPAQAVGRHRGASGRRRRAADLVLAIYNPASKTRTWQVGAMRDLLLEHRDPGTPW